jgi:hypothetical protein
VAFGYPASNNTFVPSFDATGKLVVSYSRNPKDFPINKYAVITPVKRSVGYYLKINVDMAGKVVDSNLADKLWHDGNDAPQMSWGSESFQFVNYSTLRYANGFRLGYKAIDQADWQIVASHAAIHAQQAMTDRTQVAATILTNNSNYASGHTGTATAIAGGKFNAGSSATPYLKIGLLAAAQTINADTLGVVQPKDLLVVMNPNTAKGIAVSNELMDAFKQSPFAWPWVVEGKEVVGENALWGLPPTLYGFPTVVENTVKSTNLKGASVSSSYVIPDGDVYLLTRKEGLVNNAAPEAGSFSSLHFFMYEEMTVETKDDPDNRRTVGRIVEDYTCQLVAPLSSYRITAAI